MKHSNFFFLQVVLMSIMSSNVSAYDFSAINDDGVTIYYNYDGDGVSVTTKDENYNSYSGEVRIPSKVSYSAQEYNVTSIDEYAFAICSGLTSIEIPSGVTSIGEYAFWACTGLSSIEIPSSVTSIGLAAFSGGYSITSMTVEWSEPIVLTNNICDFSSKVTLNVPSGSKTAYELADYWKDFKEIKEYGNAAFTMNSSSIATYCNSNDLDFTEVKGLKAYIASGFSPSTGELMMVRVNKVPAGEGLLLKGAAGDYEIPYTDTDMYYSNLLVGVPVATTVSPTDGSFTNFILANDAVRGIGFYTLSAAGEISANKAYLQLPTSALPASSRQLRMVFDDEETASNEELRMKSEEFATAAWHSLDGRKLSQKPTAKGLYIKGNKKVVVK